MADAREEDIVEWLVRKLASAHVAAYVLLFPEHDGFAALKKEHPELTEGGKRFVEAVARRMVAEGVGPTAEWLKKKMDQQRGKW